MEAKSGDESSKYRALVELLRTAETIWNASRVLFARWELSPSQFNVLNLLRLSPRGLSQSELSRELIMHRSNVTGLVDRLEQRGWVERQDVERDRRAYRVVITSAGLTILREILPGYYEGAEQVWKGLKESRVQEVIATLQTVAKNAERVSAELPN